MSSVLNFLNRYRRGAGGKIYFRCWTFEELTEAQIQKAVSTIRMMEKLKVPIVDYAENDGYLVIKDGKAFTGCFLAYQALIAEGAVECDEKHEIEISLHPASSPKSVIFGNEVDSLQKSKIRIEGKNRDVLDFKKHICKVAMEQGIGTFTEMIAVLSTPALSILRSAYEHRFRVHLSLRGEGRAWKM